MRLYLLISSLLFLDIMQKKQNPQMPMSVILEDSYDLKLNRKNVSVLPKIAELVMEAVWTTEHL